MLALVYDGEAPRLRSDCPRPQPGEGEALVAVRLAGVCKTDLEVIKGYMGFTGVMGHEFVGEVVEGPAEWRGKRVVGQINCVCGRCDMCRSGLSNHCRDRTVIGIDGRDGAFAEFLTLPVANLHEVPAAVSDEEAVFVEPLAAAFQVIRQVQIGRGDRVVVLGDGRLGQLVARVLKSHLARQGGRVGDAPVGSLVLVGKHTAKLEAAEKQSIRTCLLEDFAPAREADVVIDATGTPGGFELAMQAVRPRGTIVLKSTFAAESGMNLAPLVIDEITVVGSRCGPFADALAALAAPAGSPQRVEVADLISRRFPLSEGLAALQAAGDGSNLKVVLDVAR